MLGFKDSFNSWIKLLYTQPVATVIINGQQSKYFSLQEVHVSFENAIEPFATAFRQSKDYLGIECGGLLHKLSP